jgi:hypothetical protein
VRIIVRDKTLKGCAMAVSRKVHEGWEPVTKIKMDDSSGSWGSFSYICVMEKPDTVEQEHARKQRRFNHNGLSGY